ncbi:MAG: TatD family hydrolase [Trebonia sp.]
MVTPPVPDITLPAPGAFDAHTHMDFTDVPVESMLDTARTAGIHRVVNVGCDIPSSRWAVTAASSYPEVYAAVAIHPNDVAAVEASRPAVLSEIAVLAASPRVVAVGETGLDYYRDHSAPELQRSWFRAHVEIAREAGKPVMIHDREAHSDVLAVLEEYAPWPPYSVIFHCFSGDAAMAAVCAEAGYVMSFAGNVTFKNAGSLREAAVAAPAELMLAETDAPYLTPVPYRGKPNSPAMTAYTVRFLAELKDLDLAGFCAQLQSTGARVFGWLWPPRSPAPAPAPAPVPAPARAPAPADLGGIMGRLRHRPGTRPGRKRQRPGLTGSVAPSPRMRFGSVAPLAQ